MKVSTVVCLFSTSFSLSSLPLSLSLSLSLSRTLHAKKVSTVQKKREACVWALKREKGTLWASSIERHSLSLLYFSMSLGTNPLMTRYIRRICCGKEMSETSKKRPHIFDGTYVVPFRPRLFACFYRVSQCLLFL